MAARARAGARTKKIALALLAGLLVLAAVLVARAAMFTLDQGPPPQLPAVEIDSAKAAETLAGALRFKTVSVHPDPAAFAGLREYLAKNFPLAHTKLSTEAIGRDGLLFVWKGSDPAKKPILLMAHQDVVPVDGEERWTHPPFAGEIADGYVWGRGALDVKSGLIGILTAVERLLAEGHQPARTIYLAFGHDEEVGGQNGAAKIAALLLERKVRLEMVLDEGGAIVDGIIPGVASPVALIGIAEKGYVSLELSAEIEGGHSSMPPRETAIGVVSAAIAKLEAEPFPARLQRKVRFFDFVGPKMEFSKRIIFANLWLFEPLVVDILSEKPTTSATIRTTTAPTIFQAGVKDNVLPNHASAIVNFRIIPGETPATVMDHVKEIIGDARIEVKPYGVNAMAMGTEPSPISSIESEAYRALAETIRGVANDPELVVAPNLVVGATDSRYFQPVADDVYRFLFNRLGPADIPRIHGTDERISVENFAQTIRFYYELMKRMQ